ncbi:digestive cysteine proteinase 1-like [Alosa pseudoharengus]|uniref:digestive cysteine proteinase 1-like n=1 Tax=Alosa pseudoharengus TaxID=34774 RepID=UPI003F88E9EF
MKLLLIAAASLAVVSCASLSLEDLEFHAWKLKFGKSYRTPEEEARCKDIWLTTRRRVLTHNILADQGIKTYRMGMNHFSDMDNAEYRQKALMNLARSNATKTAQRPGTMTFGLKKGPKRSTSVDWREEGCVTPVKDQQSCASSWAFSATGALESQVCIAHGKLVSLSEQQLIDCGIFDDCSGGTVKGAYDSLTLLDDGQLDTEDSYPYEAKGSTCRFDESDVGAVCTGYDTGDPGDEEGLEVVVALLGPISVTVDAGHDSFQSYQSGVYDEPSCQSTGSHAMLVVGYGTEDGQDYWLVKNSWGVNWGDEGYIKMSRNKNNQCGIASATILPKVK